MTPDKINVLIACEESQAECAAFRKRGFNAFSCDIQPCQPSAQPNWHIHGDVTPFLQGKNNFRTQDGELHFVDKWHMIIAHPPCTYMCKMGSVHMVKNGVVQQERFEKMMQARELFFKCLEAAAQFVAVENPIPMARAKLPKPDCFIQPYWYGVKYSKKTLYWLKNLPPLMPELINPEFKEYVRSSRGKYRSRTFPQVARAIAKQWGDYVIEQLSLPG